MKKARFLFPAAVLLPAFAQAASHDLATFIGEYDLNKDGTVSKEEFQKGRQERFAATDVNNDDGISLLEYAEEFRVRLLAKNPTPEQIEKQMKQTDVRFNVLDSNKDGRMSSAEYFYSGWRMYAEHDYSRDGAVSMADKTDEKPKEGAGKRDRA
jgi:hypothetical protein